MGREVGGGDSGWGTRVHPWLIHVNGWQKPLQYCKVISLQLKYIHFFKKSEMQASLEQGEGLLGAVQHCQSLLCVRKPAADPSKWVST